MGNGAAVPERDAIKCNDQAKNDSNATVETIMTVINAFDSAIICGHFSDRGKCPT
jgi:hypothetical protein